MVFGWFKRLFCKDVHIHIHISGSLNIDGLQIHNTGERLSNTEGGYKKDFKSSEGFAGSEDIEPDIPADLPTSSVPFGQED